MPLVKKPEGEWFYDVNDPEYGTDNYYDLVTEFGPGEVVAIEGAKVTSRVWGVEVQTDADGNSEVLFFDNEKEAVERAKTAFWPQEE